MNVGVAVFAYNRNTHLRKTLEGLRANRKLDEIYIFQDGLKTEEHRNGWEASRQVIASIDWCKVNYFGAEENKGLACSIVEGIEQVLQENDAVIVLEDDCVPTACFLDFMSQCFEKYRDNKDVYSISGYAWPIEVQKGMFDIYFTGRASTWGWGTWKDRWNQYEQDLNILERIKNDRDKSVILAAWGKDLEKMYADRLMGRNDSWAVFWALKIIEEKGLCAAPYVSLIQNIGFDGTGVHCGKTDRFRVDLETGHRSAFRLPDSAEVLKNTVEAFAELYGSYTSINTDRSKANVIIYGLGNFFMQNEKYLNENYYIRAFMDRAKSGYFAGRKIIQGSEVRAYQYDKIIIMIQDVLECKKIKNMLKTKKESTNEKIQYSA